LVEGGGCGRALDFGGEGVLAWGDGGPENMHYRISDTYSRGWGRNAPPGVRVVHEVCHIFDVLRWLADSDVATLYAVKSRDDDEIFTLTFESGCVASITSSGWVTTDLPKERLELIANEGSVLVEEFVELRAFGFRNAAPVQRFAGHSHPDREYSHKHLFAHVGAEALYGMRRTAWELGATEEGEGAWADQAERQRFLKSGQMWNYMVDKGWLQALDHFAVCVARGTRPENAGARDALAASRLAQAAIESRESGEVVRL
jgi:predicted dehydrogenase